MTGKEQLDSMKRGNFSSSNDKSLKLHCLDAMRFQDWSQITVFKSNSGYFKYMCSRCFKCEYIQWIAMIPNIKCGYINWILIFIHMHGLFKTYVEMRPIYKKWGYFIFLYLHFQTCHTISRKNIHFSQFSSNFSPKIRNKSWMSADYREVAIVMF